MTDTLKIMYKNKKPQAKVSQNLEKKHTHKNQNKKPHKCKNPKMNECNVNYFIVIIKYDKTLSN